MDTALGRTELSGVRLCRRCQDRIQVDRASQHKTDFAGSGGDAVEAMKVVETRDGYADTKTCKGLVRSI